MMKEKLQELHLAEENILYSVFVDSYLEAEIAASFGLLAGMWRWFKK